MKKLLSLCLALICLCSICVLPVGAAGTNYCTTFNDFLSSLYLMGFHAAVSQPDISLNGITLFKMLEYSMSRLDNLESYADPQDEYIYLIPASVAKTQVSKYFDLSGAASGRFDQLMADSGWDETLQWSTGGYGDSAHFTLHGYVENGNNLYTVYGYSADYYDDNIVPGGAVLGRDYVIDALRGNVPCPIDAHYRIEVRLVGSQPQFISCTAISSIPTTSAMIQPGTAVTDPTTKAPTTQPTKAPTTAANTTAVTTTGGNTTATTAVEHGVTISVDSNSNIRTIDSSAFEPGTTVSVHTVSDAAEIEAVEKALSSYVKVSQVHVMEWTATKNNANVQPNGGVSVDLDIPDGFDPAKIQTYYVSKDRSSVQQVKCTVDTTLGMIQMVLPHFSTYVIVEGDVISEAPTATAPATTATTAETASDGSGALVWIFVISALVLVAIGVTVFFLLRRNKR